MIKSQLLVINKLGEDLKPTPETFGEPDLNPEETLSDLNNTIKFQE